MRLRSIPNAKELLPSFSNYVPEPGLFKERWSSFFGNFNEIQLEIGAGKESSSLHWLRKIPG